jgi:hypothetical protein
MIEIDVDPRRRGRTDGTLRDLFRSLQFDADWSPDLWSADHLTAVSVVADDDAEAYESVESLQVVQANLPQLRSDLEFELRRLIERLLAAM